jgi:hypothetical protein
MIDLELGQVPGRERECEIQAYRYKLARLQQLDSRDRARLQPAEPTWLAGLGEPGVAYAADECS